MANEKASKCIKYWKEHLEQNDNYYVVFEDFEVIPPFTKETLHEYLCRIANLVEKEGRRARLEWRALKSFLAYMRKLAHKEIAFIEQIFPKHMDIKFSRIIRKIPPEVYPISQEVARDILSELAHMATKGRPDAQLSALESLGFARLCLTASRLRLPSSIDMLIKTNTSAVSIIEDYPAILVPTLFGDQKIRISYRIAKFLLALSKVSSDTPRDAIIQKPKRSLMRTFSRAVKNCKIPTELGNITFSTLLSPPHHFGSEERIVSK